MSNKEFKMLDDNFYMVNCELKSRSITLTGGTIKVKIKSSEDLWLKCSRCEEFFNKHYYIHQCDKYHIFCNKCLIDKKKCKNCSSSFVKKLKIKN